MYLLKAQDFLTLNHIKLYVQGLNAGKRIDISSAESAQIMSLCIMSKAGWRQGGPWKSPGR